MSDKKPTKTAKLVLEAIKNSKTKTGVTPKEIIGYIQANHEVNKNTVKGVHTALKRGENYGFLRSDRGKYSIKESPTLAQLVTRGRPHDDCDPDLKGLCKPRKRSGRRRRGRSGRCSCGRKRGGSRRRRRSRGGSKCGKRRRSPSRCRSRRRRRSRGGSKCGKRRRSRSRSRSRRRCSCGKKRRGGRRRSRRGGRSKCGGRRGRGGRSRRRSRRGGSRSRRRRAKCRC